jgi:hypothetical protein
MASEVPLTPITALVPLDVQECFREFAASRANGRVVLDFQQGRIAAFEVTRKRRVDGRAERPDTPQ